MSKTYLYYHNPRCSKSRQGLELLQKHGIEPIVKEYLKESLKPKEVKELLSKLDQLPIRTKEKLYKELELKGQDLSSSEWAKVLSEHPSLLERPILIVGNKAMIGRPPEDLISII